jgi:hypothetical protein
MIVALMTAPSSRGNDEKSTVRHASRLRLARCSSLNVLGQNGQSDGGGRGQWDQWKAGSKPGQGIVFSSLQKLISRIFRAGGSGQLAALTVWVTCSSAERKVADFGTAVNTGKSVFTS